MKTNREGMKKVLTLTLNKLAFDVMVTGEKGMEFRKPSKWIKSRLYNKDGSPKQYDVVKFINGYGKDKPTFICEFKGVENRFSMNETFKYSNGLTVTVEHIDIIINLGKIGITRNLK